jgi:shikimate kinase
MHSNLALIGFQACGKTTLGKQVAISLQKRFCDTDRLIEQFYPHLNCRQIYHQFGEIHFRFLESQVVSELHLIQRAVIATGGGSLLEPLNAKLLKQHCVLVYLSTPLPVLKKRILSRTVLPAYLDPQNPEAALDRLYQQRLGIYENLADITLNMQDLSSAEAIAQLSSIAYHL